MKILSSLQFSQKNRENERKNGIFIQNDSFDKIREEKKRKDEVEQNRVQVSLFLLCVVYFLAAAANFMSPSVEWDLGLSRGRPIPLAQIS